MIYDDYHFEKIAFHFSTVNQYIIYPKKKDMFIYDQIQLFFIFRTIPIRETFRSRCIPLLQRVINLLINRHPTILETNFNSPMMGRITHLSISIARGASTSRCIHIDDTCLITLGWKPTSPPRLSVSFSCRRQNHSIRIEPKPGADAISTNISRTFGNRSNRPSLSLSRKTGIEQSFSTCSSFHPSNYRRIILVG